MEFWIILAAIAAFVVLVVLATSLVCFFKIFYFFRSKKELKEKHPIPEGEVYEAHRDNMVRWIDEAREFPHRELQITSRDGLKLYGNYYEFKNDDELLRGKVNSSSVYNRLKVGQTYRLTVIGVRIPLLSTYQNIIKVEDI